MEALNFPRFWKPSYGAHKKNQAQPCYGNSGATQNPKSLIVSDHELDEGEDSFIDLELPLHEFDDKANVHGNSHDENDVKGKKRFDSKEERPLHEPAKNGGDKELDLSRQTRSLSPNDHFSKRKIIPIEPSSKPQSPIALLKSAPKFRIFTLKKSKSMANTSNTYIAEKTEFIGISMGTPKHEKQGSSKHFKVKFKIEESPNLPIFTRETSLRKTNGKIEDSLSKNSSKRLSKDRIQKYLNKIKPLYVKVSQRDKVSGDLSTSSPAASPATIYSIKEKQGDLLTGVRGVCKQLGKSRSASAAALSVSRRDDSLLLQHDGIQSAILHCKKSFNSSRESSWLSRCTSDSSQGKLSNASSTDSSLLSRVKSNSSYEKLMDSARISSERNALKHLKH
ncbi:probable membrane-associated kinase regulator 5 isoform X2 [Durio zibethinus]|uniref:Probable membrane-associated kinase regulator 5 isoform X2 n=1 Tax=Durio zibethinus TaxID=66656 RepID=A0A6P5YAG4_DURZI|nr:probable membrane-associated kinase regulator 5 isoform X2 [Durio zibethinus]